MSKHYDHISGIIVDFFRKKGMEILIEPHGSRGVDIEGADRGTLVGEIKHADELHRDLGSVYWSAWNSDKTSFGGKKANFQLRSILPHDVERIEDGRVKGWIAVVFGQLRAWVKKAGLKEGWVVYEDYPEFEPSLLAASDYLRKNRLIGFDKPEHSGRLGFLHIRFAK